MKNELVIFNGIRFRRYPESKRYAHRMYFRPSTGDARRGIQALHQEVWKFYYGPIPRGYDIHHKDHNAAHNAIDNLECLPRGAHRQYHHERYVATPERLAHLEAIRPLTVAWHQSEEGRLWHQEHGKDTWKKRQPVTKTCAQCGNDFSSRAIQRSAIYCSKLCQGHARTARGRHGTIPKTCPVCQKDFMALKNKAQYCSYPCSIQGRYHQQE